MFGTVMLQLIPVGLYSSSELTSVLLVHSYQFKFSPYTKATLFVTAIAYKRVKRIQNFVSLVFYMLLPSSEC